MKCINEKCDKRSFCGKVHISNKSILGEDETIYIPNRFFYDLNVSNRLVKRGIPDGEFNFGCFKLAENKDGSSSLYMNNKHCINFSFSELVDTCNNAISEMIENGEIKITN
jgi:hypothetical protein